MASGSILVVHTGWSRHWRSPAYLDHPYLGQDAAEGIVAAGVRTVAIDAMSVDETPPPGGEPGTYVAHDVLLGAGGAIVENLTNLDAVDFDQALLSVLPIRLADADGAPVRAGGASTGMVGVSPVRQLRVQATGARAPRASDHRPGGRIRSSRAHALSRHLCGFPRR